MIHLDTNYLLGSLTSPSSVRRQIMAWIRSGETIATSSVVWSEFLTGPVSTQEIQHAQGLLQGRIIPFDEREAEIAAKLFNHIGRKRAMRTDCFIAATALRAGVPLATLNKKDFNRFATLGLRLA
jgi:predicted nucleic acid-binding protein